MSFAVDLHASLERYFGFQDFRPGQLEACQAALADRDVLVVMPTGSGKSLCYQLPGLMRDDLTIVVSPLVALMQDQVEALHARGLGDKVALVNAQQDNSVNSEVLARAADGSLRLLYVSPERFSSPGFLDRIGQARIGLFVVDEAHCVSQWGHDFRPDYFRLADAARHLGAASIVASTATATPQVASDIVDRLGLADPLQVATGFDRPNLSFAVARPAPHQKRALIAQALKRPDSLPAIVYAGTRAGAEEIAEQLTSELGEEALAYHAGLARDRRATAQRRFLSDDVRVIVATNAFGMGVDKPNVRTVLHASVPSSLEAYYQEAGRAGRDGLPSRALLLAENRDKALHVHFIKRDEVDPQQPAALADRLMAVADGNGRYSLDSGELGRAVGGGGDRLRALIGHLARAGVVSPTPSSPDRVAGKLSPAGFDRRSAAACRASVEQGARARWRQYREIWAYVESEGGEGAVLARPVPGLRSSPGCRRQTILRHFGDRVGLVDRPEGAECCDVCDSGLVPEVPKPSAESVAHLDDAIVSVAQGAQPAVGRTTCAEILHGGRSKKIQRNSYDGLPAYGTSSDMRRADILARVDELIAAGTIATTDGPYPVLKMGAAAAAA